MIDRNDILLVLLPASKIPTDSIVSKKTGTATFKLVHKLKVYREDQSALEIDGAFLLAPHGRINQINSNTNLHWHTTATNLLDHLNHALEDIEDK